MVGEVSLQLYKTILVTFGLPVSSAFVAHVEKA